MTSSREHVDERPTDPNDAGAVLLDLVGANRRVLELGTTGGLTRWLADAGCEVTAVVPDETAAETARESAAEVVVGDLESLDLEAQFGDRRFEVVVCAGVLGRLRDPGRALVAARRLLEPGGRVVASVPNVAHGDVRAELLAGRFEYRDDGLLDPANVTLLTRDTLQRRLVDSGLIAVDWRTIHRPLGATELAAPIGAAPPAVLDMLEADPDAETYQFVVVAVPDDGAKGLSELSDRLGAAQLRADRAERENEALRAKVDLLTREAEAARTEAVRLTQGLSAAQAAKSWKGLAPLRRLVNARRGGA
ncbi:MAG: class I SAM-dependent methyltransferase [Microthrixaceae bacterium]